MQRHTISLCMIVKNEEKYLGRCLKSVQGKVDEIIIVDTGSTDGTVKIAKKYNAVIKHFEWINDFAAARNYSISEVKTDYILVLDADEYFDDSVDIQKALAQNKDFYMLMIKNYQSSGLVVFHQNVRIFKSGIGLRYSGKLHEQLNTYDEGQKYIRADSDIVIHHTGYLMETVLEKDKKKRNYDIMITELEENPTGYSYFNMGLTYMNNGDYDKALDMFKKSYPLSKSKEYVKGMLVRMGECLNLMNRAEEGIKLLSDAICVFPKYTDLHYTLGRLFLDCGYRRDAEIEFRKCLRLGEGVKNISTEGVGSYIADYHLALIYESKGRSGDAFEEAYKAITKRKSFTPALSLYIKLMQQSGIQPDKIKEHLSEVYQIHTIEELKALIYSLYEIRHPLLGKYESAFGAGLSADIRAVVMMLNKQYDNSLEEWKKVDKISRLNVLDAVVLCLLTKDRLLLDKIRSSLNFSNKEWKTISGILLYDADEKLNLTSDVEKLLFEIGEYLININEFDQFQYISTFLLQCSIETQEKLASVLLTNGFIDTALELLNFIIEKNPRRFESNILIGEAYVRQNKLKEALECFTRGLAIKNDYSTYEKIYDIYDKIGDKKRMEDLTRIMKGKFPLSLWLKSI